MTLTRNFCLVLVATLCPVEVGAVNLLLNSWESGDLEGWEDSFGSKTDPASLAVVTGTGATEGSNALQFTLLENDFEWSINRFLDAADPQFADFMTAIENPAFHEIQYDLTYDLDFSNPDEGSFFNMGLSISSLEGASDVFHQGFALFGVGSDVILANSGQISGTTTVGQNLSSFSNQPFVTDPAPGFIRPIIPINGNWDAPATFIIDNFRIIETSPAQDLDGDLDVDIDDFTEFTLWHKSDFTGLTPSEALARGDFDGDFDSDFQDYLSFESVYDQLNGAGALAQSLSVPEPSGILLVIGGIALLGVRFRRGVASIACLALLLGTTCLTPHANAQLSNDLLESWESGVAGWTDAVGNGAQVISGASLSTSSIGATLGSSSLAVTQNEDTRSLDPLFNSTYSYDAEVRYFPGAPQLDLLNSAFDIGATNYELQVDVTYDSGSIPSGSNVKVGIGLEGGSAAFNTVQNLASVSTPSSGATTLTIAESLSSWSVPQQGGNTFFDISFGLNSNWGSGPATVHFDNLRLVQLSEPSLLTLEIDGTTGVARILNGFAPGSPVEFDYYEIVSESDALNPTGWQSLDANLDPDDGWSAAGGSGSGDLTEINLTGSSILDGGEDFGLGTAFSAGGSTTGLAFRYREPSRPGALRTGLLSLVNFPEVLAGDYNGDNVVDAADYTVWRDGGALLNETVTPGEVTQEDYDAWAANFGATTAASSSAIPEPATFALLLPIAGMLARRTR